MIALSRLSQQCMSPINQDFLKKNMFHYKMEETCEKVSLLDCTRAAHETAVLIALHVPNSFTGRAQVDSDYIL